MKQEVYQVHVGQEKGLQWLGHHVKGLEVAASSYHKVLEENRLLYNQVQDLKGTIRVYCRVRPFLSEQCNGQSTVDYIGENGNIMIVNPQKQGKEARTATNICRYPTSGQICSRWLQCLHICIWSDWVWEDIYNERP